MFWKPNKDNTTTPPKGSATGDVFNIPFEFEYKPPPMKKEFKTMMQLVDVAHAFNEKGERAICNDVLGSLIDHVYKFREGNEDVNSNSKGE